MASNQVVKMTMRSNLALCTDSLTGEVSLTKLAEVATEELDLYELNEIPEWVFDIAYEVANESTSFRPW